MPGEQPSADASAGTLDDSLKTLAEIQSVQGGEISTDMLRLLRESTPGSLEFFVLDPTGRIVATSTDESVAGVELGGSETHRWHLDHPGEGLYVSSPLLGFIGAGTGETLVRISRSWRDDHGRLGGISVASFATERLRSYHSRLRLGDSGVISQRRDLDLPQRRCAAHTTACRAGHAWTFVCRHAAVRRRREHGQPWLVHHAVPERRHPAQSRHSPCRRHAAAGLGRPRRRRDPGALA